MLLSVFGLLGLGISLGWLVPELFNADDPWQPPAPPTSAVTLVYVTPTPVFADGSDQADPVVIAPAPTETSAPSATFEPAATATPPPEAAIPVLPVIDAATKDRLRAIHLAGLAAGRQPNVFIKVGDSITVAGQFLTDFGCGLGDLGDYAGLAPTVEFFRAAQLPIGESYARCGAGNSFTRRSIAAGVGWSAIRVLAPIERAEARATREAEATLIASGAYTAALEAAAASAVAAATAQAATAAQGVVAMDGVTGTTGAAGPAGTGAAEAPATITETPKPRFVPPLECQAPPDDTPLRCEIRLTQPGIALVMFGTNDLQARIPPAQFKATLAEIAMQLEAAGVIPVLSTIPPRTDQNGANARVSSYNMAVVELARERQLPLWNYWAALSGPDMVGQGMAGDGVHPEAFAYGSSLTPRGLQFGQNQRNLTALQILDKLKRVVIEDGAPE